MKWEKEVVVDLSLHRASTDTVFSLFVVVFLVVPWSWLDVDVTVTLYSRKGQWQWPMSLFGNTKDWNYSRCILSKQESGITKYRKG